jgi:molybdopterin synthase catalytic subunit
MIKVQAEPFDMAAEIAALTAGRTDIGGLATFVGLVRDLAGERTPEESPRIEAMTLEHYPCMTEKKLAEIEAEAERRWPLQASLIVHRYGRMLPGEPIVLVATASRHRAAASSSLARAATQRLASAVSSSFQKGALVFSQSIRKAQASSAAARCAAAVATRTIGSPGSMRP